MFGRSVVIVTIVLTGWAVPPTFAGLYNTADALDETRLSPDFKNVFSGVLGGLRTISVEKPERDPPIRKRYVLMESLGRRGGTDLKTLEQQLDFSVVLIRRGKADEAIQFLLPLTREHDKNFVILSHMATACFLSGQADFRSNAGEYMKEALEKWPAHWDEVEAGQRAYLEKTGWSQASFDWYRKCEVHFEKLMRHRRKKQVGPETLDPLFPVRFVNQEGAFEPGRIAGAEREKLPADAVEIVEQLLVWTPNDLRLYWLLGELFNARAMDRKNPAEKNDDIRAAYQIMKELVGGWRGAPDELLNHYEKLRNFVDTIPADQMPKDLERIVNRPDDEEDGSLLTNRQWWRTLIVGFITGFAVGLFALWQFQELRRRRQVRN